MLGLAVLTLFLQRPVALPDRAMRLEALLRAMSVASGEAHRATAPMASRIVLVAGPARPLGAIRADLATATWGAWRHGADGWTLDEDLAGIRERDRLRLTRRVASVRGSLAAMAAKGGKPFDAIAARALAQRLEKADAAGKADPQDPFGAVTAQQDAFPALVALRRVVLSFTPEALAALPDGRFVFSDRPNRLQRPLPAAAGAAIRAFERDQNLWAETYSLSDEGLNGRLAMDPRGFSDSVAPGSLRIVMEARVTRQGVALQGWFVDAMLQVRGYAQTDMDATNSPAMTTAPTVEPGERPLPLGPGVAAYTEAMAGRGTPAMRAALLHPETDEPLDFAPAEVCRALGRARHAAVTIWLDDNLMAFGIEGYHQVSRTRGNTASEWIRQLWIRAYNAQARDGAIVFRPRGAATNVDRGRLGALLRASDAAGCPPLDDLADYAASLPRSVDDMPMIAQETLNALLPGAERTAGIDLPTLRLWGTFSRLQRKAFLGGAEVPFATLTPVQRDGLVASILKADPHEIQRMGDDTPGLTLRDEPTELLADGFTVAGGVKGTLEVEEAIVPRLPLGEAGGYVGAITPSTLAWGTAQREKGTGGTPRDGLPQDLSGPYVAGRLLDFGLRIPLSPTLIWSKTGQYGEFDLRAKGQPLSAMPHGFLDEVERQLKAFREQGTGGQGNPPSPFPLPF